ncbi:hypothetical protein M0805_005411 [Coniferiporia weirii]|nr:hypothetical protein M0805_005411 [Coniferiporia weirii]
MSLSSVRVDQLVARVHAQYAACAVKPSNDYQYTVLAAFVLDRDCAETKVVSLATGSKCLPTARYPPHGDALHDSHAEVLARRGLMRWLHDEVRRAAVAADGAGSLWIVRASPHGGGKWMLRPDVALHMYVSTVPCGDASTRFLAAAQDPAIAALKDAAPPAAPAPGGTARGRDGYALHSVLRTKPGRADSPPTRCMSCSDKIAAWGVLGAQGALAARLVGPVYVSAVVLGDVPSAMRELVRADCERAFFRRVEGVEGTLPEGYRLSKPTVHFTDTDFAFSRSALHAAHPQRAPPPSSNESLCWFADSSPDLTPEVIINGVRRGVGAKQRGLEKYRPRLCKLQLLRLHLETVRALGTHAEPRPDETYYDVKQSDTAYCAARSALKGPGGPFAGWVVSGEPWESFDAEGNIVNARHTHSDPPDPNPGPSSFDKSNAIKT